MDEQDRDSIWRAHRERGDLEGRSERINGTISLIPVRRQRLGAGEISSYLGWTTRTFYRWTGAGSLDWLILTSSGHLSDTRSLDAFHNSWCSARHPRDDRGRFYSKQTGTKEG